MPSNEDDIIVTITDFNSYQAFTETTAIYDDEMYPLLGLIEEVGELYGKLAKFTRDGGDEDDLQENVVKELGDIMWMLNRIAADMNIPMQSVINANVAKLVSRQQRGKLGGSGDNR